MNSENIRLWIIGICVALVIVIVAAATAMNKRSDNGQEAGTTSESGMTADSNASMGSGDQAAQGSSMSDNRMDHSSHGGQAAGANDLDRYPTEQDPIMMNMTGDMIIREESGSASIGFLKGMIPRHETTIKMSESCLNYGREISDLQAPTQGIITAQKKGLVQMNDLIKKCGEEGKKNQDKEDVYLAKHSEMFSDDSMSHHINPPGVDNIDQTFAEGMTVHHQMAVDMAKDVLDCTDGEEVEQLAQEITSVQEKEIGQMQKLVQK